MMDGPTHSVSWEVNLPSPQLLQLILYLLASEQFLPLALLKEDVISSTTAMEAVDNPKFILREEDRDVTTQKPQDTGPEDHIH